MGDNISEWVGDIIPEWMGGLLRNQQLGQLSAGASTLQPEWPVAKPAMSA
jgi:hypothetical protein